ncbi:MAG: WecB/TagA/CpsF family glycosyltransferase [Aquisalimonadaceae bacterium]
MDDRPFTPRPRRIEILGVPVDTVDMHAALHNVRALLAGNKTHVILAANPEKVIAAQQDERLLRALHNASLVVPDGIGIVLAARLLRQGRMQRVAGSDLMTEICRMASPEGYRVFLYGAKPEIAAHAALRLQARFPGLKVVGTQHGYLPERRMDGLIDSVNDSGADVLFVGLGSPRQEYWMERHRDRLSVAVCQGVGGTFDALCGYPRRAPPLLQRLNLEWLYRLITQPRRANRQLALPWFVAQVLRQAVTRKQATD